MSALRLLVVEGSADAALLIVREVEKAWPEVEWLRVETAEELEAAFADGAWDAVVADYSLRGLGALETLRLVRAYGHDGPFVVVSDTVGEEMTVAAMRAGADDYVRKDDLRRLVPALERGLEEARLRTRSAADGESEARFRALIESSLDVTMLLKADATIRYASPSVERMLGFRPEELVGRSAFNLVHPEDVPALAEIFRLAGGSPGATRTTTYRSLHRDGTWRLTEAVGLNMLADPSVRGIVIDARDITSRRALEERLNQAERLEAIGRLAGGIAHDFNNILLVIRGYSGVLGAELTDPRQVADVEEITKATERAANLTQQLLVFGRRQVVQPRLVSLATVVRDAESLLRTAVSEGVALELDLDDDACSVVADPAQLEQVLVNLVVNARDAMPEGGTITVALAVVRLDEPDDTATPPLVPGTYTALSVADTGSGIPEDVLPHVFEPFFTTKEELGTGLGLAAVYGVVTQSGGSIGVRTAPGEGTSITVYLPAASGEVREAGDDAVPESSHDGPWESVLLVEDEEPVRDLVRRVLQRAGYRVHAAALPSDALRVLEDGEHVDLLLTDVVMPEMSGYQLAARVLEAYPEMRTLFISGYAHAAAQAALSVDGDAVLLQKPFAPSELARAVRHVLDGTLPPEVS